MILGQDQRLKDLDHRSKISKVIFNTSKDPDHFNDLDLSAKRSPIFPIYVSALTSRLPRADRKLSANDTPCSNTITVMFSKERKIVVSYYMGLISVIKFQSGRNLNDDSMQCFKLMRTKAKLNSAPRLNAILLHRHWPWNL